MKDHTFFSFYEIGDLYKPGVPIHLGFIGNTIFWAKSLRFMQPIKKKKKTILL